ncbi:MULTISPECIES: STAS domain-containing protein [unclassified Saccharibacter]|uniref:STAS domain-containing protein n=1 Tax=unclassified Saccharibacter TaxID=2648722 RepID=UPI001327D9E3|nr:MULTISPECIES: STAS domain-containing protein [unclassified Saccharibacter]MXV36038.1 STAS domain-containing protein [Saccharibacter sp. EH611]MXV56897.1 STAS domain-containing protein [Saccharibacter sp. EH70]MXV66743.1 STAS domain-containing protein [Saccharibacter sp. EH60]
MAEETEIPSKAIKLPARLDTNMAPDVRSLLLGASGDGEAELRLDASEVEYIGGLCLQLILSSHARITSCSEKASEALALFGVRSQLVEGSNSEEV